MAMTKLNLVVNLEVAEAKGEDANLAEDFLETFLMGVFDGLGGRSAGYDGKTGGRIASEIASQISQTFFKQWHGKITPEHTLQLQQQICQSLKSKADIHMPRTSSRLKGSLVEHKLCTTIALASILKQQGQEKIFEADLAWMGDSRIYFLSPTKGLQQLTKDDLVTPKDALEMLRQDPPMSQYLTADINPRWQIHFQHYRIEESGCFLACTDGCFQYFSAPWEFERLLLDTCDQSKGDTKDTNNWQELIYQRYTEIKQDDVSLILYPVGFHTVKSLRNAYKQRWEYFQKVFFTPTANTRYDELQSLWEKYRIDYEYYFQFIQYIEPSANLKPSFSEDKSSVAISTTSNLSTTDPFQEITESSRQRAAAKAEEIQSLLDRAKSCFCDENNQLKEAEELCNQILKIDDHHSECQYILGWIYTKLAFFQTNNSQKLVYFNKSIFFFKEVRKSRGEKIIESLQSLGRIYYNLYQWDNAVDSYQESFRCVGAEKIDDWEEHLEMLVTSLRSIVNKDEAANLAIQFCQHLASNLPSHKKAYPYYFMAVLQEITGQLSAAWNSIQKAIDIYDTSYSSGVRCKSEPRARKKYKDIQNRYYDRRSL
ncbi:protein phosphatase 2C domain-containing protein [Microcoleus sp. PH2017_30_WIL_O_A]|uniref:protein phosphatase 2C domain-containing protein n=1 Tax=Microcoleus sp. PH2017_30_WIL_O_A TaxID=2798840 RepID=UPI001D42007E|nr:protein phosphatase 2C domain-containing protein [Microcoleus sp. PH2017_30_WIL_O_A]MCC3588484.1 protein phosphatase 2C domain-containing protein [Microcoleus sp. PH2017_30_WIL_O_A]